MKKQFLAFSFIFIQILILTGCIKKRPVSLYFIDQAKLTDIPLPVGIVGGVYNLNNIQNQDLDNLQNSKNFPPNFKVISGKSLISLKFNSQLTPSQLENFYIEHMDIYGWQLVWHAQSEQNCMIFQRPHKVCVIFIESDLNNLDSKYSKINNQIRIMCGPRS